MELPRIDKFIVQRLAEYKQLYKKFGNTKYKYYSEAFEMIQEWMEVDKENAKAKAEAEAAKSKNSRLIWMGISFILGAATTYFMLDYFILA